MEHVVKAFKIPLEFYEWTMSKSDPRTTNFPLCGSPFPILSIIFCYLYFVKVAGPQWMKNRAPFKIGSLIVLYNVLMVIFSAFFFLYVGSYTYIWPWGKYSWICQPIDYGHHPEVLQLMKLGWCYLILKIAEFADTIFFVLRKKFTHVSALHVMHHSLVVWGVWLGFKFGPGGNKAFFVFINCFVHIIMYSYYCLAALGPGMRKYLWWKKYLTILQMIQFVIVIAHAMVPLFYDCGYHKGFAYVVMAHALLFMVMFMNFYRHAYNTQKLKSAEAAMITSTALKMKGTKFSNDKQDQNDVFLKQNDEMAILEDATKKKS